MCMMVIAAKHSYATYTSRWATPKKESKCCKKKQVFLGFKMKRN